MIDERPAILLIAPTPTLAFVAQDIRILSREFHVDVLARSDHPSLRDFVAALLHRLRAKRYALVYVWFAEPYDSPFVVMAARAFGLKCAIVVGGYDVAALPALGYGALATRTGRWKVRFALRAADALFPTSDLLAAEVRELGRTRGVRIIYPGVDCARFVPGARRERLVATVGTVGGTTWILKGLDVFARCSRLLPDVAFVLIGPSPDAAVADELRAMGGPNLTLTARFVAADELAAWFGRATVYAQLSARESFGLALAEAMASGCVPVATAAGFMPEVVGDTGFLVEYGNVPAAVDAIGRALAGGPTAGAGARARVEATFSLERRERELLASVSELLAERAVSAA